MTVTRSSLLPSTPLPSGWRTISARLPTAPHPTLTFYLSPEGKRFRSLQGAKTAIKSNLARMVDNSEDLISPQVSVQAYVVNLHMLLQPVVRT